VFIVQAYQTSQYVVPCGGIFLGKWRSSFAGSSDGKMNVQSACALNTRYFRLKCNPLSGHLSSSLQVSATYGHHQVLSILLKLLHSMSTLYIARKAIYHD
jgi:hypothetical protein